MTIYEAPDIAATTSRVPTAHEQAEASAVLAGFIQWMRYELKKLGDHPAILAQGGVSDADRACRAINKLSSPDFFWDDRCLETAFESISEATAGDEVGAIIELRPLHELDSVFVLITESGYRQFLTRKAAEAAKAKEE